MKQKDKENGEIFLSRERFAHSDGETRSLYLKVLDNKYNELTSESTTYLKILSAILVFLGGLVAAVSGLFAGYCVCVPKSITEKNYVLFVFDIVPLAMTFAVDICGCILSMGGASLFKDRRRPRQKKSKIKGGPLKTDDIVLTDVDGEEKDAPLSFRSMTDHYANDREDSINKLEEKNKWLKWASCISVILTVISCIMVLVSTVYLFIKK